MKQTMINKQKMHMKNKNRQNGKKKFSNTKFKTNQKNYRIGLQGLKERKMVKENTTNMGPLMLAYTIYKKRKN